MTRTTARLLSLLFCAAASVAEPPDWEPKPREGWGPWCGSQPNGE